MLEEFGSFKYNVQQALFQSDNIRIMLLGADYRDIYQDEDSIYDELKKYIYSHLFIDEVIKETRSFIFYDVFMPRFSRSMKNCTIEMYIFCNHDLINSCPAIPGYEGNRVDMLCQMVEEEICSPKYIREYGIGQLQLSSVSPFSNQKTLYGKVLEFSVPDFR